MPQKLTREDWLEVSKEVARNPRLGLFLFGAALSNTVKAGWEAPRRWYGFFRGYPFWRYLSRD